MNIRIRYAEPGDAEALLRIYAPYVEKTAITFEYEVPDIEEFASRIAHTIQRYPYFVAEAEGECVGYAYVGAFQPRKAYEWSVETSIYIAEEMRSMGIGRKLSNALEEALKLMGITNMNACIATPVVPDETLTDASVGFHRRMGYRMVGEFQKCGCKFGKWYNMCWMEKSIGPHEPDPAGVKWFPEVMEEFKF